MKLETLKKIGLKKIKFYDITLFIAIISFITSNVFLYFGKGFFILPFFTASLFMSLFMIGMLYHSYRRKQYGWFLFNLFAPFATILFYFIILRKAFKRGEVNYKPKIREHGIFSDEIWKPAK